MLYSVAEDVVRRGGGYAKFFATRALWKRLQGSSILLNATLAGYRAEKDSQIVHTVIWTTKTIKLTIDVNRQLGERGRKSGRRLGDCSRLEHA